MWKGLSQLTSEDDREIRLRAIWTANIMSTGGYKIKNIITVRSD